MRLILFSCIYFLWFICNLCIQLKYLCMYIFQMYPVFCGLCTKYAEADFVLILFLVLYAVSLCLVQQFPSSVVSTLGSCSHFKRRRKIKSVCVCMMQGQILANLKAMDSEWFGINMMGRQGKVSNKEQHSFREVNCYYFILF